MNEIVALDQIRELRYYYEATVLRWVDADTVEVSIDLGVRISYRDTLRLRGIDAYEMNTKIGQQATAWVRHVVPVGSKVMLRTHLDAADKYGRLLADVWHASGEPSLNDQLVAQGYAVRVDW